MNISWTQRNRNLERFFHRRQTYFSSSPTSFSSSPTSFSSSPTCQASFSPSPTCQDDRDDRDVQPADSPRTNREGLLLANSTRNAKEHQGGEKPLQQAQLRPRFKDESLRLFLSSYGKIHDRSTTAIAATGN
jgi:hypothetical protein